jgi:hypothetical protein
MDSGFDFQITIGTPAGDAEIAVTNPKLTVFSF